MIIPFSSQTADSVYQVPLDLFTQPFVVHRVNPPMHTKALLASLGRDTSFIPSKLERNTMPLNTDLDPLWRLDSLVSDKLEELELSHAAGELTLDQLSDRALRLARLDFSF